MSPNRLLYQMTTTPKLKPKKRMRMQAALRRVRAHAPAPGMWYAAAPGAEFADAPAEAAAEAPTVYVSRNAAVFGSASAPTPAVAPFGVEAPAASAGFMPLTLDPYPGTQVQPHWLRHCAHVCSDRLCMSASMQRRQAQHQLLALCPVA